MRSFYNDLTTLKKLAIENIKQHIINKGNINIKPTHENAYPLCGYIDRFGYHCEAQIVRIEMVDKEIICHGKGIGLDANIDRTFKIGDMNVVECCLIADGLNNKNN